MYNIYKYFFKFHPFVLINSIIIIIIKKVSNAKPEESGLHSITPKTPAPQHQPIEIKKRHAVNVFYTYVIISGKFAWDTGIVRIRYRSWIP